MAEKTKKTVPALRFRGFTDEWQEKKLGEYFIISNKSNAALVYGREDVLSVSDELGVVNQIEHLGRSFAGVSLHNYGVLEHGELVYTKSPLRAKPYGVIKENHGKSGIVSVLYAIYRAKEGVSATYFHYYFDPAWRLNAYLRPIVNIGAKNTMNISDETVLEGWVSAPSTFSEQERIGEFFSELDGLIRAKEEELEKLRQMKAALLEAMFPSGEDGTNVNSGGGNLINLINSLPCGAGIELTEGGRLRPRLRFRGFTDDWQEKRLGEFSVSVNEKHNSLDEVAIFTNSAERGIILQDEFFDHQVASLLNTSNYTVVSPGDFVYNPRISVTAPVGPINQNRLGIEGIVSPIYIVFRPQEVDLSYLEYYYKTSKWHSFMMFTGNTGARGDRYSITEQEFFQMQVPLPSLPEQEQIGAFFLAQDEGIAGVEAQLTKLTTMKSALLERMFA